MSKRILVVDDHDVVRKGVRLILSSHPEWEVSEAEDGCDALAKIQMAAPDLVILDISMPSKDGLEVLAELSQVKIHSRVLVLTMHDSMGLASALQKAGAAGYVIKTHAGRDLITAVEKILDGSVFFPAETAASLSTKEKTGDFPPVRSKP